MSLSNVTNLSYSMFSWLILPGLLCLFSRFKKYIVFFLPSLYHLHFDLKIAPLVLCSIISSSSLCFFSSSLCVLYCFPGLPPDHELRPISFCCQFIFLSNSSSILDMFVCLFRFCIHHRLFSNF